MTGSVAKGLSVTQDAEFQRNRMLQLRQQANSAGGKKVVVVTIMALVVPPVCLHGLHSRLRVLLVAVSLESPLTR